MVLSFKRCPTIWCHMLLWTFLIRPAGSHCPNSYNCVGLQHHVFVKWSHRRKEFSQDNYTALSCFSMNTMFAVWGFCKSDCVAQVAFCTHVASVSCAQHHSPYFSAASIALVPASKPWLNDSHSDAVQHATLQCCHFCRIHVSKCLQILF